MIEMIIDMDNNNSETLRKSEKALLILCDLFDRYSYPGDHPTKQEADKLSHEAERILEYINIASDYVFEIKNDLKQSRINMGILFDEAKQKDAVRNDKGKIETHENTASLKVDLVNSIIHLPETDERFLTQLFIMVKKHVEKKVSV